MATILSTGLKLMRDVKVVPRNPAGDSEMEADRNPTIPE